jgi:hypothetical protein
LLGEKEEKGKKKTKEKQPGGFFPRAGHLAGCAVQDFHGC